MMRIVVVQDSPRVVRSQNILPFVMVTKLLRDRPIFGIRLESLVEQEHNKQLGYWLWLSY